MAYVDPHKSRDDAKLVLSAAIRSENHADNRCDRLFQLSMAGCRNPRLPPLRVAATRAVMAAMDEVNAARLGVAKAYYQSI